MRAMWAFIVTALVFGSCAQKDWIDRTLVTVDVTGTWHGFGGEAGPARARLCSTLSNRDQRSRGLCELYWVPVKTHLDSGRGPSRAPSPVMSSASNRRM